MSAPAPTEYRLREPVELRNVQGAVVETVEVLKFQGRVKAAHFKGLPIAKDLTVDQYLTIAGRMTGQSDRVMAELGFADMTAVLDLVAGFLSSGLQTGQTPSQSSPSASDSPTPT